MKNQDTDSHPKGDDLDRASAEGDFRRAMLPMPRPDIHQIGLSAALMEAEKADVRERADLRNLPEEKTPPSRALGIVRFVGNLPFNTGRLLGRAVRTPVRREMRRHEMREQAGKAYWMERQAYLAQKGPSAAAEAHRAATLAQQEWEMWERERPSVLAHGLTQPISTPKNPFKAVLLAFPLGFADSLRTSEPVVTALLWWNKTQAERRLRKLEKPSKTAILPTLMTLLTVITKPFRGNKEKQHNALPEAAVERSSGTPPNTHAKDKHMDDLDGGKRRVAELPQQRISGSIEVHYVSATKANTVDHSAAIEVAATQEAHEALTAKEKGSQRVPAPMPRQSVPIPSGMNRSDMNRRR